jgi:excisionase family DNA binding protein
MAQEPGTDLMTELQRLGAVLRRGRVCVTAGRDEAPLPNALLETLREGLAVLESGGVPTVVARERELSTQDAAALLNVSRQYVVRLVERGVLPAASTEGGHRRLRLKDVLAYRGTRDAEPRAALQELEQLSEDSGGSARLKRK